MHRFHPLRITLAAAILGGVAQAEAPLDVSPLVNDTTVLVVRADLRQIDVPAFAEWAGDLLQRNGLPPETGAEMTKSVRPGVQLVAARLKALRGDGVDRVVAIVGLDPERLLPQVAIAMAKPRDAASVMEANEPLVGMTVGDLLVLTPEYDLDYFKTFKPAARDAGPQRLAAADDAVLSVSVTMTDMVRDAWAAKKPDDGRPTTWANIAAALADLKHAALAVDVRTEPHLTGRAEFATPAAADRLRAPPGDAEPFKNVKSPEQAVATMLGLLGANVEGTTVTLDAKTVQFDHLAKAAVPAVLRAREMAKRAQSMSNMRQLLVSGMMFANDNRGAAFGDFDDLAQYLGRAGGDMTPLLTNPARPELKGKGYVYVHPGVDRISKIKNAADRLAIYEAGDFGDGLNVGFWDGHVEFIGDKARFDKLLETAKNPPQ